METAIAIQGAVHPSETPEQTSVDTLIDQRVGPGMLVLAPPMRVLHVNQHAGELIRQITQVNNGHGRSRHAIGRLPMSIRHICEEIFDTLRVRDHAKDWERLEIKRVLSLPNQVVLVRGFGVPDCRGREYSRVVLLLETIGRRKLELNEESNQRFHLTEREQEVVQCLTKGMTNKAVATTLRVALPTVKEHVRHIMDKTNTTTRTGILVRLFHR